VTDEKRAYKRIEGFDWKDVPDGYVVYDEGRETVHFLNLTAAAVLELCDGRRDLEAIAALLKEMFDLPSSPRADVETCLASLVSQGLVAPCSPP
jgi:hypothetical protein